VLQFCCSFVAVLLQRAAVCCSVLQYVTDHRLTGLSSSACRCVTVCCSFVTACCSVLQCVALCFRSPLESSIIFRPQVCCSVLQCVAVCCSVLHYVSGHRLNHLSFFARRCVAVCCSVLQCVAGCYRTPLNASIIIRPQVCRSVLQCVVVCCNVLQRVAKHC